MIQKSDIDVRDMPGATWRDVAAAVLKICKEPVTLTYLYEQIEPHKKAKANKRSEKYEQRDFFCGILP